MLKVYNDYVKISLWKEVIKMKTLTVKKLDVMSVAMFAGVLAAVVSLFAVVLAWGMTLVDFASFEAYFPNMFEWNTGSGILAFIFVPLVNFVVGWVYGAVIAWLYNIALGSSKGVKIEVEE